MAAGNEETDLRLENPASYNEVLTATSMTDFDGEPGGRGVPADVARCDEQVGTEPFEDDTATFFSNYATLPEDQAHTIAASGVCVVSLIPEFACATPDDPTPSGCEGVASGTSFSAPAVAGTAALCIATGKCTGTPAQIIQKLVADARTYNLANPGYGFVGDPLRPFGDGRYYGYLIRAGLY